MAGSAASKPPRPIHPGDIVAAYSAALGEWTVAQVTDLNVAWKTAGVLELDWSGSEPSSVTELGHLTPLTLTHHDHLGRLSHCNFEWLLPRSYKVIGATCLLSPERSNSYSFGWNLGKQLAFQRRWDRGDHSLSDPAELALTGDELNQVLVETSEPCPEIRHLNVKLVTTLDCQRLVTRYPYLIKLSLVSDVGFLTSAGALNHLSSLKTLYLSGLFGMDEGDCVVPLRLPELEFLSLHSIPAGYAAATRSHWRKEVANGTFLDITAPRRPEWVAENMSNPLREWDGRKHISGARYKRAVSQYKGTRRAILEAIRDAPARERDSLLFDIGRQYGEAFNKIDGRNPFIETVEREELFVALDVIVDEAEADLGVDLTSGRKILREAVETVRDW